MYALQDYGYTIDAHGDVTIFGRVERMNDSTGLWEVMADFTGNNRLFYPDIWTMLTREEQDSILQTVAPRLLMMLTGAE